MLVRGFELINKFIYKKKCGTVIKFNKKKRLVKGTLSDQTQFLATNSPLKKMKMFFISY